MEQRFEIKKKELFFAIECFTEKNDFSLLEKEKNALEFLTQLAKKNLINLYLISGAEKSKAIEYFKKSQLQNYFEEQNYFFVTNEYIDSKNEFDRQRHLESLNTNANYFDYYFKQVVLLEFLNNKQYKDEEMVLLGKDLLFDAFYTTRFSKIDFVLMKENLSMRGEKIQKEINGLNYFELSPESMSKVISWDFPAQNFTQLEKIVFDDISKSIIGNNLKQNIIKQMQNQKPAEKSPTKKLVK